MGRDDCYKVDSGAVLWQEVCKFAVTFLPDDLSEEPRDVSPAFSPHPYCTRESQGALGLKWGRRAGHRVESTLLNC